jgi:hypothetical protein
METWVTDQQGDPVFMVIAEPSGSLAAELRRLLPALRGIAGQGRRVTVCFDRGGWSPALFADITGAGFDLLTWRKGPAPDLPADEFTTITCTDDRGREHHYDLADTTVTLTIHDGPRKGQAVSLRQVIRRVPAKAGGTQQLHALRLGRPGLPRRRPGRPRPAGPQPGQEDRRRPSPPRRDPHRRGPGPARRQPGGPAQPGARPASPDRMRRDRREQPCDPLGHRPTGR